MEFGETNHVNSKYTNGDHAKRSKDCFDVYLSVTAGRQKRLFTKLPICKEVFGKVPLWKSQRGLQYLSRAKGWYRVP
jgi:hypothetical protein